MEIDFDQLKMLCIIISRKLQQDLHAKKIIDADYYWSISAHDMFDLNLENPTVVVGSLVDDWNSLLKILSEENPVTSVDYERLGNVLKAFGEIVSTVQHEKLK